MPFSNSLIGAQSRPHRLLHFHTPPGPRPRRCVPHPGSPPLPPPPHSAGHALPHFWDSVDWYLQYTVVDPNDYPRTRPSRGFGIGNEWMVILRGTKWQEGPGDGGDWGGRATERAPPEAGDPGAQAPGRAAGGPRGSSAEVIAWQTFGEMTAWRSSDEGDAGSDAGPAEPEGAGAGAVGEGLGREAVGRGSEAESGGPRGGTAVGAPRAPSDAGP